MIKSISFDEQTVLRCLQNSTVGWADPDDIQGVAWALYANLLGWV